MNHQGDALQAGYQPPVAGMLDDEPVQVQIEINLLLIPLRPPLMTVSGLEPLFDVQQIFELYVLRRAADRPAFQGLAYLIDLFHIIGGEGNHSGSPIPDVLDKTVLFEDEQDFSDRCAADPVNSCELL